MASRLLITTMSVLYFFFCSEATLAAGADTDRSGPFICPLKKCKSCPTRAQLTQPGFGFALEMGYGTAAIRWHNGTVEPVAQVAGSPSYISLMRKLAYSTPETRFPHDIPTTDGRNQYVLGRLERVINKLLGRPANVPTSILASVLNDLKVAVENVLPPGQLVTHALVTSPDSMRLTAEEVGDVLDYLQIKNTITEPDELYSSSAAFVGYGHGLCNSYSRPYTCATEEIYDLPFERVLVVDLTDTALRMTIKGMQSFASSGADSALIDPELGFVNGTSEGETQTLFAKIGARLRHFVQEYRTKITMILLTGTQVSDERFKETLRDALAELVAPQAMLQASFGVPNTELDQIFANAKGAAEVSKRRLEGPVRCVWWASCKLP